MGVEEDKGDPDAVASLRRGVRTDGMANPAVDLGTAENVHHSHYE